MKRKILLFVLLFSSESYTNANQVTPKLIKKIPAPKSFKEILFPVIYNPTKDCTIFCNHYGIHIDYLSTNKGFTLTIPKIDNHNDITALAVSNNGSLLACTYTKWISESFIKTYLSVINLDYDSLQTCDLTNLINKKETIDEIFWAPNDQKLKMFTTQKKRDDHSYLPIYTYINTLKTFNLKNCKFETSTTRNYNGTLSNNKKHLALYKKNAIEIIFNFDSENQTKLLIKHDLSVHNISWSPDDSHIATGSYDGTIKIWDIKKKSLIATIKNKLSEGKGIGKVITGTIDVAWTSNSSLVYLSDEYIAYWQIPYDEPEFKQSLVKNNLKSKLVKFKIGGNKIT